MTHSTHPHRITGRQARELLELARNGTGLAKRDADHVIHRDAYTLVETVAWLYGREPGEYGYQFVSEQEYVFAKADGSVVYVDNDPDWEPKRYMSPGEAVDLARALLAAAEEARHE